MVAGDRRAEHQFELFALHAGIIERLLEAIERGMWENPPPEMLEQLKELYLDLEADLEARQEGQ